MLIPSTQMTLDEIKAVVAENGHPSSVIRPISMIVYEVPDDAMGPAPKRRGRPPKVRPEASVDEGGRE